MTYAPIALFTYNRADKTKRVVESLLQNQEAKDSDLFIFSDGPKTEAKAAGVKENRKFIYTISGFKNITIIERDRNWGLANSLIAGITDVINQYGKVIVVEDDLVLSPYFLKFMNDGLEKYEDDDRVVTICGYVFPFQKLLPDTFFLYFMHPWGWATWKRSWDLLDTDTKRLLRKMRFKTKKFNLGGNCGSYGNLYCQKVGLVDSWYIRFYASLFLNKKLNLFPGKTMVTNSGLDGSGTHCGKGLQKTNNFVLNPNPIKINDISVEESQLAYSVFKSFYDANAHEFFLKKKIIDFKSFIRRALYIDCM